jgi:hypothetical protein
MLIPQQRQAFFVSCNYKTTIAKMGISLKTHKMLWGRSGNRCALPICRKNLVEDETETDDASIVGDEAHIVARENDGPRGISLLTPEERDKYDNLILMCKVHHKMIDDQPLEYTVEKLHQMKSEHLEWVSKNLSPDIDKQKDDEIYATYIDKWIELADINNWKGWSSFVLGSGQPEILAKQFENLKELNEYILSRVWPKRYDKIEFAFNNFRIVINDFINVFSVYKEKIGNEEELWYSTEKIYKRLGEWDNEKHNELSKKFDFHVDLVQDLMCEMTRAANYLCDQIRKQLSTSFRIKEGVLLVETGPDMSFSYQTVRLEFKTNDQVLIKYPGLEKFMETRQERGYHFGNGVCTTYLKRKFD